MIRLRSSHLLVLALVVLAGCHHGRAEFAGPPDLARLRAHAASHPTSASAWRALGLAELHEADGDPARALAAIDHALELAPNDPMLHYARAQERTLHGHPSDAVGSFLRTLELARDAGTPEAQALGEVAASDLAVVLDEAHGRDAAMTRVRALVAAPGKLGPAATYALAAIVIDDDYRHGDAAAAKGTAASVGCLAEFRVAGPFGPRDLLEFDDASPVTATGPLAASYDLGPTRGVRPTRAVEARGCAVHLGEGPVLAGGRSFAEAFVDVPRSGDFWLRIETPNSHAVYVDGREIARVDRRTSTAARVAYHAVHLDAGRHEITIAVATRHPNPVLFVALAGDDGLRVTNAAHATGFTPALPPIRDTPSAHLRASMELARGDVVGARETLDAVIPNGRSGGPELALRTSIALSDPLRPEDVARDDARALLRVMAEHDANAWFPPLELARLSAAEGRDQEAIDALREASPRFPELASFPLTLASLELGRGFDAESDREIDEAGRRLPESCVVIDAQRGAAARRDRIDRVRERSEALVACDARSTARFDVLASARRWDEADHEIDRLAALDGRNASARWIAMRLRIAQGRGDAAATERLLVSYATERPRADATVVEQVDSLLARGERPQAIERLDAAIAAEPMTMAQLRILRATLGGDDPLAGFRVDGGAVLAAYEASGRRYDQPEVYVLDYGVTRIFEDGSSLHLVHQVIKLQSEEAVDAQGEFSAPGDASLLKLHTIKADGTRLEPDLIEGKDTISLPNLEVGDSIEYEYVRALEPSEALLGGILGDRFYFQSFETPFDRSEFLLVTPENVNPVIDPRGPLPEPSIEHRSGLVVRKWLVSESRPRTQEPMESNPREWLPSMNYGVGATWDAFRDTVLDGLADRDVVDPDAVRLVLEILGDDVEGSDEAKARRLYAWVLANVEATDALLGEASKMLASRAGSRARVLHYLLGIANVPADLVLVRPFSNDQTESALPDEETYTTVLVRVGDERTPTFLATNQRGTPYGYVPAAMRGQDALVLRRGGGKIRVPAQARIPDRRTIDVDVALAADGSADVAVTETFTGVSAISWRGELEEIPDAVLEQRFEEGYASRIIPGASLTALRITGRHDPEAPLVLAYTLHVPEIGHREGDDRIIPGLFPTQLASGYAQAATRTAPQLVAPLDVETTVRLRAPEGGSFPTVPESVTLEGPGGATFRYDSRVEGRTLVLARSVRIPIQRVAAEAYPDFARFVRQADRAEGRAIRVR